MADLKKEIQTAVDVPKKEGTDALFNIPKPKEESVPVGFPSATSQTPQSAPAQNPPAAKNASSAAVSQSVVSVSTSQPPSAQKNADKIAGGFDLGSILLPKKETHTPQTATRINAGALLEASTPEFQVPAPIAPERIEKSAEAIRAKIKASAPTVPLPPAQVSSTKNDTTAATPHAEHTIVAAVHTFKGDIEETVRDKNVSYLTIAAAEAKRRDAVALETPSVQRSYSLRSLVMGTTGVFLLLGAGALLFYVFTLGATVPFTPPAAPAGFIYADETKIISLKGTESALDILQMLESAREGVALALGLVSRIYIAQDASGFVVGAGGVIPAPLFLSLLAPSAPNALVRSLEDAYIVGVHSFDGNQPFIIFKTNAYEQTYAGMLSWEQNIQNDLSPLFLRTPRERTPDEIIPKPAQDFRVVASPFIDAVVENHDARVIRNDTQDILLLWAFADRQTLVLTTNEYTFREVLTRLKNAPTVPLP